MDKTELIRFIGNLEITESGCWSWKRCERGGYGLFRINDKTMSAHRVSYQHFYGDLDPNLTIDHQCNNRSCVNPIHLKQMTQRENGLRNNSPISMNARKTHCKRGHPLFGDNLMTRTERTGFKRRSCKACTKKTQYDCLVRKLGRIPKKRLIPEQVLEIRKLYAEGSVTHKELGLRFGVVGSQIGQIIKFKSWVNLKEPHGTPNDSE
jgi:hypothetical protein